MIRPGFLSSADRIELEACVRRQREDHGIARRANAILLLDDGESCALVIPPFLMGMDSAGHCNSCSSLRTGVRNPKVFRGRLFRWFATLSKSCCE